MKRGFPSISYHMCLPFKILMTNTFKMLLHIYSPLQIELEIQTNRKICVISYFSACWIGMSSTVHKDDGNTRSGWKINCDSMPYVKQNCILKHVIPNTLISYIGVAFNTHQKYLQWNAGPKQRTTSNTQCGQLYLEAYFHTNYK